MTSNQIAYWRLQEDTRAHLAQEAENVRSAKAKEAENYRHNVATEQQAAKELQETNRSNQARELETHRHNQWGEWETAANDLWHQGETTRHNLATENIGLLQAAKPAASHYSYYNVVTGNSILSNNKPTSNTSYGFNIPDPVDRVFDALDNFPGIRGVFNWLIGD